MKLLFLTHPYPNYVPDLLLHGLRKLIGPAVVDYPRKDCVYDGVLGLGVCPPNQLCPGWFPADGGEVDREDVPRKIRSGFFDCVVCDVRALQQWIEPPRRRRRPRWRSSTARIAPSRSTAGRRCSSAGRPTASDGSIPLPMSLPEEIFNWIAAYDGQPKRHSIGFLGSTQDDGRREFIEQLAAFYPDGLFSASVVPSERNPFPAGALRPRRVLPGAAGLPGRAVAAGRRVRYLPVLGKRRLQRRPPGPAVPDPHPGRLLRRGEHPAVQRHRRPPPAGRRRPGRERRCAGADRRRPPSPLSPPSDHGRARYFLDRIGDRLPGRAGRADG